MLKSAMKNKNIILFTLLFILMNGVVFYITELNKEQRVKVALDKHLYKLKVHYEVLLHHQKVSADVISKSTIAMPKVINILSQIKSTTTKKQKAILREKLFNVLKRKYEMVKKRDVLQYHFVLPDNKTFLRMHKPSKFGDDISDVRYSYKCVNKTKKQVSGFEQGKTTHAFRHVYPIFSKSSTSASDKKKNYLGALGVDFPSEVLQDYLTNIGKLHTHFLIHKDIFNVKAWERKDDDLKYLQSSEHKEYMITMTDQHTKEKCVVQNELKLKSIRSKIDTKILQGKPFSSCTIDDNNQVDVLSFYPIKNIKDKKIVAWLVSYEKSDFLSMTIKGGMIIRIISFFGLLLLFYFIYRVVHQKEILDIQVQEKTKELKLKADDLAETYRELEESDAELQELNSHLEEKIIIEVEKNSMQQKQIAESAKMVQMGEMIGNIAHQWRQPLSVISTSSTGMLMQKECGILSDELFEKYCNSINDNAQYLSKTIDDFKNYIKGDRTLEQFDLKDIVEQFLNLVEASIKSNNLDLILDIKDDIKIEGYPNELIQCFINIFNNAKDILIEQEEWNRLLFIITTQKEDNKVIIKFKDSGGGIPSDIIDKIFEPYFTTKHQSKGTGLGLHMTYNLIVEGMKGTIKVDNVTYNHNGKSYKGAEFTIEL